MVLLYVTDNGFCKKGNKFYYSAPNVAHISNLSSFFDEFIVVARDDKYEHGYHEVPDNIKVHLVDRKSVGTLKRTISGCITKVDAVMCYGTNGYFASVIGRKHDKVVISYNGGDPYDFCLSRGNIKGKLLAPIARYMCRRSFLNSDFGHYCDDFLFERYPASGPMLACSGVDIVCDEDVKEKRIRKIQGYTDDTNYKIGLIGHTRNSLKGIDIAIKAISKLPNNYYLEIAGRGETDNYLKLASELGCQERIKFLGPLAPGAELFSWLDTVDIYIQPSRIEGLPRATIEAMSRACPVVSSNVGALSKLVDSNYIFDIKSSDDLFKLITSISDKETLLNQSSVNFDKSRNYEKKVRDQKYKEFYSNVVLEVERRKKR